MKLAETAGSWRVAIRVARRSAARSKARTLLIVLMLALPVYAGTVLALSYASTYTSADTEASWRLGQADWEISGESAPAVLETLPPGSRTARVTYGRTVVRAEGAYSQRDYAAVDVDDELTSGIFAVRAGRAPRGPDEAAVSAALAEATGVTVGGRLAVGVPPRERTVVGIVDPARELSIPLVVTAADQPLSGSAAHTLVKLPPGEGWSPDMSAARTCEVRPDGREVCVGSLSTTYRGDLRPSAAELATRTAAFVLVVGFAGLQVALLAGAAFAVGARRQRRELAMIAAVGASRAQVARMVLANGLVLGVLAGGCGVALGALTYQLNKDTVERLANHPLDHGAAPVGWLAAIALFAVVVGLLAAAGPARGAARQGLRTALSGREPVTAASNLRWLVAGLLIAAGGAVAAVVAAGPTGSIVTVTAGAMAILLGVAAATPVLVAGAGRLARRLPLAVRLAVRHAARHRLRTAASAAAVCTAVAGSMALMLYNAAEDVDHLMLQPDARPGQVLVPAAAADHLTPPRRQALEAALPTRAGIPLVLADQMVRPGSEPPVYGNSGVPAWVPERVAVGGADLIRAVTGAEAPPAALAALRDGGAVAFYPHLIVDGQLRTAGGHAVPAVLVPAPDWYTELPAAVVAEETAARLGLTTSPAGLLVDTTRPATPAEYAAANSVVLAAQVEASPTVTDPAPALLGTKREAGGRDYGAMFLVLAAVSAAVTLAASAVAVGLATAEMRGDLSTLAAVGAGPRLRRRIAAAQAGLIVGIGAALGVVGGIAPAAGMVAFRDNLAWRIPWLPLAITVVLAPVAAVLFAAVLTRPRLVLVRRLG
ncbi:FtsX-like permease family protein [Phytohabitans kaempferiae]|uniref:FtsX-like permease family protein n=1 Tax=Phytohabitans kaempferiae TaxID=1620943 RepID=A0ABV6MAV9_9ACTN